MKTGSHYYVDEMIFFTSKNIYSMRKGPRTESKI